MLLCPSMCDAGVRFTRPKFPPKKSLENQLETLENQLENPLENQLKNQLEHTVKRRPFQYSNSIPDSEGQKGI